MGQLGDFFGNGFVFELIINRLQLALETVCLDIRKLQVQTFLCKAYGFLLTIHEVVLFLQRHIYTWKRDSMGHQQQAPSYPVHLP